MAISISMTMKNNSAKNMVGIEPCGTPKIISSHSLHDEFIFVLRFLLDRWFCICFKPGNINSYAFSIAIRSSRSRKSNAFDKTVSKALKVLPLSKKLFQCSSTDRRDCCVGFSLFTTLICGKNGFKERGHLCEHNFFINFW